VIQVRRAGQGRLSYLYLEAGANRCAVS
jgi:hypothetical protein